jgi:hypothetical protein
MPEEYLVVVISTDPVEATTHLNSLSKKGWKVVGTAPDYHIILARSVERKKAETRSAAS